MPLASFKRQGQYVGLPGKIGNANIRTSDEGTAFIRQLAVTIEYTAVSVLVFMLLCDNMEPTNRNFFAM